MQNLINWVEIPVTDFNRALTFYSTVLSADITTVEMMGTTMGLFPSDGSNVSGAIVKGENYTPSDKGALVYLNGGNDLNTPLSLVEAAGGKVLVPKTQISPEMGYFALFADCEGNTMAFHSIN
jgi:predicted enzyme related to lactoylglutathione lyase